MLDKCKKGEHRLETIFKSPGGPFGTLNVVRWCNICGSIVVDVDVDGRTAPGQTMKMKSPAIAKVPAGSNRGK